MPVSSKPIRLDAEIVEAAKRVAPLMSRSVAQQLSHWARLGRQLETSPEVSFDDVLRVLEGEGEYDTLSAEAQALVRSLWSVRAEERRRSLRLDLRFEATGVRYAELDDAGQVVIRDPGADRASKGRASSRRPPPKGSGASKSPRARER